MARTSEFAADWREPRAKDYATQAPSPMIRARRLNVAYLLDDDAAPPDPLDEAAPLPEPEPPLLLDAAPPLGPAIPPLPLEVPPEPDLEVELDDDDLLVLLPPLLPGDTTVSLRSWQAESAKTPKSAKT
jgi:hypothetical protein